MTKIVFYKKNDLLVGFKLTGHTNFAAHGEDVLCAGISAISQGTCLGIEKVLRIKAKLKKDDNKGYLELDLTKNSHEEIEKAQVLIQTMYQSLLDISIGNEKYMNVEVYDEIY